VSSRGVAEQIRRASGHHAVLSDDITSRDLMDISDVQVRVRAAPVLSRRAVTAPVCERGGRARANLIALASSPRLDDIHIVLRG
jgi:hypothetical protein